PGDCNGDGAVTISELVTAVGIALGGGAMETCTAADVNDDGTVAINELVAGVGHALGQPCPTEPTPTVTPAPGEEETRCTVPPGDKVNLDPTQPFCELLSSYRFFRDGARQEPNDGVLP